MSKTAAIYARVSSDQQREQNTIGSQTAALREYAQTHQLTVPPEWVFEDEGYSGSLLVRPGLERLRDLAAEGAIETVLVHGPDPEPQLCLPSSFIRGICSAWSGSDFSKGPSLRHP